MKRIQILATSDIHAYIMPDDYTNSGNTDLGLASVSTIINKLRDENTILIDNGDFIQGSPLSIYLNKYYPNKILPLTKVVNQMKYDYYNLGNHDFNNGKERLLQYINNTEAKCITYNVNINGNDLSPKYYIHRFENGLKIAIFGIITDFVKIFESAENLVDIEITDTFIAAQKCVNSILANENVDYVVGVYHGGFEKDFETLAAIEKLTGENIGIKMLQEIDGIDVLVTGHQHRSIARKFKSTIITQTNCNGKDLAQIELFEDSSKNSCSLIPVTANPDKKIVELISEAEGKLQNYLSTNLTILDKDLKITDNFESRLNKHELVSFINQIQMKTTGADISGVALFNGVPGYNKEVKVRDVIANYPYSNTLKLIEVNGVVLKEYLEENARYFDIKDNKIIVNDEYINPKLKHYNYDMIDGIDYTIKVSNSIGNRIVDMKFKDKDIKNEDIFKLVVSNYRYTGVGGFEMIAKCPLLKNFDKDMTEIVIDYLTDLDKLSIDHKKNIEVII
jgi:2',3'-cyclic-nucleotide 2'-phosphodiesterase/3'-nucleotidase